MKTLSEVELELVTGGKVPDTAIASGTGSGGGSDNDAVLAALNNIQSSLKDIGKNNNGGLFGGNNGLLFMTMALAMSRRNDTVVYAGGGGGCGPSFGGQARFSFRARW
ncbi:MAG TPA: hypothetical protein VIV11_13830 [Kofleriaceae bacterium]